MLGHFALTGLLQPAPAKSIAARFATLSSAKAYFECVNLANLMLMIKLARRAPWLESAAAHRGAAHTGLQRRMRHFTEIAMSFRGQKSDAGALPSLYAATDQAASGEFCSPREKLNMIGSPVEVLLPKRAKDRDLGCALWGVEKAYRRYLRFRCSATHECVTGAEEALHIWA